MKPRSAHPAAFTLIELVLVLLILSVMLAMAAPSLRGFMSGARTRDSATELLTVIRWARAQTATNGQIYRLNIEADGHQYWLSSQEGTEFVEVRDGVYGRVKLPDNIEVEMTRLNDASLKYVEFHPNGRTDPATFKIVDQTGMTIQIHCPSPTESYRILTDAEIRR